MVLNFGIAAGVLYATRKSKLPFKERLKKLYAEKFASSTPIKLYNVPYLKIVMVFVLIVLQIWIHKVLQNHKKQLHELSVDVLVIHPQNILLTGGSFKSILAWEVLVHIILTVVCFVQILILRLDTLSIDQQFVGLNSYGLLSFQRRKIGVCRIQDVRVVRKGHDKFNHRTRKISVRVYFLNNQKTAYFDFFQTISIKLAKQKYVQIIAALKLQFDENKAHSLVNQ